MKKIVLYSSISIALIAFMKCHMRKPISFEPFQRQEIDSVIMEQPDSSGRKLLSPAQIDKLMHEVNTAEYAGLYKALYEFKISVYSHQDTSYRQITGFGPNFKLKQECGDKTFRLKDTALFRELWMSN